MYHKTGPSRAFILSTRTLVVSFLGCLLLCSEPVRAQRAVSLGGTYVTTILRDQLASPLSFSGQVAGLNASFSWQYPRSLRDISISAGTGKHFKRASYSEAVLSNEPTVSVRYFALAYRHVFKAWQPTSQTLIWVGPRWQNSFAVRDYQFRPQQTEVAWNYQSSLQMEVLATWLHRFETGMALTLLAYVNRPPYALEGDAIFDALFEPLRYLELGRFYSLFSFSEFQLYARYRLDLSSQLSAHLHVHRDFFSFPAPLRLQQVGFGGQINLIYRFGS